MQRAGAREHGRGASAEAKAVVSVNRVLPLMGEISRHGGWRPVNGGSGRWITSPGGISGHRGHATCTRPMAPSRPCAGSRSRSSAARSSGCSGRTARARRPPSRFSRATGGARAGEVRVLGHDPATRDRDLQQRVGIVLQSCGFYPRVTVREAVEHFGKAYDHPRDADETIELVGLGEKADARTKELSGGQRRRLDLALALVGDPELVFLDEPTTGFDPAARRTAWGVVRALKELGKTVLLTTHYLDEAQELADRVAIVKEGRIVAEGPPDQLGPGSSALPRLLPVRRQPGGAPDRRPHRAAPPPHARRDGARRAARRPRGHASHARGGLPRADRGGGLRVSPMALAWEQFRFERKLFWRNPSAAFFNFLLPLLLLVLIATAFASDDGRARGPDPRHRRDGRARHHIHGARLQPHAAARRGRPQADPRHADAGGRLPGRLHRLGHAQRDPPGDPGGHDRQPALRRRLAAGPAAARGVHGARA